MVSWIESCTWRAVRVASSRRKVMSVIPSEALLVRSCMVTVLGRVMGCLVSFWILRGY
jgi:hypothetical protein